MRHALLGMASCALVLSLAVGAADAADNSVKFKATRDIAVDSATGKFRKPNAAEIEKLVADLKAMTKQPSAAAMTSTAGDTGGIPRSSTASSEGLSWRDRRPTATLKPVASSHLKKAPRSSGSSPTKPNREGANMSREDSTKLGALALSLMLGIRPMARPQPTQP